MDMNSTMNDSMDSLEVDRSEYIRYTSVKPPHYYETSVCRGGWALVGEDQNRSGK